MLNNIPPQLIMNMFGIDFNQYNEVMQLIRGKNPQQIEQYARNLYQGQNKDINMAIQDVRNKFSQFGLKI